MKSDESENSRFQNVGKAIWNLICVTWYFQLAIGAIIVALWIFEKH
jgi:hypothetical protein